MKYILKKVILFDLKLYFNDLNSITITIIIIIIN